MRRSSPRLTAGASPTPAVVHLRCRRPIFRPCHTRRADVTGVAAQERRNRARSFARDDVSEAANLRPRFLAETCGPTRFLCRRRSWRRRSRRSRDSQILQNVDDANPEVSGGFVDDFQRKCIVRFGLLGDHLRREFSRPRQAVSRANCRSQRRALSCVRRMTTIALAYASTCPRVRGNRKAGRPRCSQ